MLTSVLDTSVLVRYLTNDDEAKAVSVRTLLQTSSDASLLFPNVAVAELTLVLLRVYRWPVPSVADALRAVVTHRSIAVPDQEVWLDVADDLEHGRGIVDAYLVRTAERMGVGKLLTFDEGIQSLPSVVCAAP
jgi:predicted nucleic acid-binding protein